MENTLQLYLNLDWLKVFYLVGAIMALAIAIVAYPTLSARSRSRRKSTKRS